MKKIILLTVMAVSFALSAIADIPKTIHYQGRLTSLTGTPVADAEYSVVISFYDVATGGTALWDELHNVNTKQGYFNTLLGEIETFSSRGLDFNQQYYVGIKVGTDGEMTPRIKLNSTAYAINASTANYATTALNCSNAVAAANAYQLEGISAAGYIRKNIANVEAADIAAGAVDTQAKAPWAPIVAYNGGAILNNPKILIGSLESVPSGPNVGEFTITFTGYSFAAIPIVSATMTEGIGIVVFNEIATTYAKGVTYNSAWSPSHAIIHYMIIGY